jgi:quercetin dioxygenase-like cupin family protein
MHPVLRLYEDVLSDAGVLTLPAVPRMIFVVYGTVCTQGRTLGDDEAWHGEGAVTVTPGKTGATCWRWEIGERAADTSSPGTSSQEKLAALLETLPEGDLLWRGDSVAFPPGGCAYPHRHQGPGIRCVAEGAIRVDTGGHSTSYGPGGAWFEAGPEPVFAQAADRPTRFIRVMILPRALLGKSSIQYVNEDDKAKPKSQQYKVYVDAPLSMRP